MKIALIFDGKRVCRIETVALTPELFDQTERLGKREDKEHRMTFEYRHVGNEYRIYVEKLKEKSNARHKEENHT